jgi:hypothetical protein
MQYEFAGTSLDDFTDAFRRLGRGAPQPEPATWLELNVPKCGVGTDNYGNLYHFDSLEVLRAIIGPRPDHVLAYYLSRIVLIPPGKLDRLALELVYDLPGPTPQAGVVLWLRYEEANTKVIVERCRYVEYQARHLTNPASGHVVRPSSSLIDRWQLGRWGLTIQTVKLPAHNDELVRERNSEYHRFLFKRGALRYWKQYSGTPQGWIVEHVVLTDPSGGQTELS